MTTRKARFEVQDILPLALTIVVAGIGIAYGLNVIGDVRTDMGESSCAARTDGFTTYQQPSLCVNSTGGTVTADAQVVASTDTLAAVGKFSGKLGLIVTVVVAAILIGVLVRYLARP